MKAVSEKRWSEMTPRERDALVAEEVFGAEWRDTPENYPGGAAQLLEGDVGSGILAERKRENGWPLCFGGLPEFSTDITAAWEVVERGRLISLGEYGKDDRGVWSPPHEWHCAWGSGDGVDSVVAEATADTAPHAICLASLKACGVEVDDE